MTLPEVLLWRSLRGGRAGGRKFRRQHALGLFVIDFYCAEARLAVEVDGDVHGHPGQARRDQDRTRWLAEQGVRVMRVPARDILNEEARANVVEAIVRAAAPSTPSGSPSPMNGGG
ncbi:MAG: endonuclease domain-containing protein [Brevundimonas sp.]